ncbi:hypothetical protein UM776_01310 [Staphylococcus aureus]|nr:hypothetical protein UM776_01310 [Staphylococcus aureus]WRN31831.1 hypothetical protein UM622_08730 [Staphylococcus aureus]WRN35989.1 hypothetical protein UM871_10105 [Staphylococcus aureus]
MQQPIDILIMLTKEYLRLLEKEKKYNLIYLILTKEYQKREFKEQH